MPAAKLPYVGWLLEIITQQQAGRVSKVDKIKHEVKPQLLPRIALIRGHKT